METAFSSVNTIPTTIPLTEKRSCITEYPGHCAELHDDEYTRLWMDFPEVTDPSMSNIVFMTTPLHITTEGPPVYTPCRKIYGEEKEQVEEQLGQWEREKVIERCESNWAKPIHAVKKTDGS